jgi:hypothetical protein
MKLPATNKQVEKVSKLVGAFDVRIQISLGFAMEDLVLQESMSTSLASTFGIPADKLQCSVQVVSKRHSDSNFRRLLMVIDLRIFYEFIADSPRELTWLQGQLGGLHLPERNATQAILSKFFAQEMSKSNIDVAIRIVASTTPAVFEDTIVQPTLPPPKDFTPRESASTGAVLPELHSS